MSSGHLNNRRFDGLWTADQENGWDVRGGELVLVVAGRDEAGLPLTQNAALELLDEVDLAELEAWSHEQGQELAPLFERVPCVSLAFFSMAKAA